MGRREVRRGREIEKRSGSRLMNEEQGKGDTDTDSERGRTERKD